MKKLLLKLKQAVRRWLGIGETLIGVDFGYHDQSCIVVASRMQGGAVKIIDCRFENAEEMENLVKSLQSRYGISNRQTFWDLPPSLRKRNPWR